MANWTDFAVAGGATLFAGGAGWGAKAFRERRVKARAEHTRQERARLFVYGQKGDGVTPEVISAPERMDRLEANMERACELITALDVTAALVVNRLDDHLREFNGFRKEFADFRAEQTMNGRDTNNSGDLLARLADHFGLLVPDGD